MRESVENTCIVVTITCMFPIKRAKRMSPNMANPIENIDSPG